MPKNPLEPKPKKTKVSKASRLLAEKYGTDVPAEELPAPKELSWSRDMHEILQETSPPRKTPPKPKRDEIFEYLKEHLRMEVVRANFTDPNNRQIRLTLKGEVITEVNFDVVQKREYEG